MQRRKEAREERRLVEDSVCVCVCVWLLTAPTEHSECPQLPERRGLALPDYLPCHIPVIPHSLKPQTQRVIILTAC